LVYQKISCHSTETISLSGTPFHFSPEIITIIPRNYSAKSDVYALGIILWEIFENNVTPYKKEHPGFYTPFEYKPPLIEEILANEKRIHQYQLRPSFNLIQTFPAQLADPLKTIITSFWHSLPTERMELQQALLILKNVNIN